MLILDCRGQQCPLPVVQVRRQMQAAAGSPLRVLVNDIVARDNVGRLAVSQGYSLSVSEENGIFQLDLKPGKQTVEQKAVAQTGPTVVFIASDQLGSGDPKLVPERLWLLLRRVQQLGVREIRGDIVLDGSAGEGGRGIGTAGQFGVASGTLCGTSLGTAGQSVPRWRWYRRGRCDRRPSQTRAVESGFHPLETISPTRTVYDHGDRL